jgi:xylulokinase
VVPPLPGPELIVISGNGPTLVPVTRDGVSLRPVFWFDEALPPPPGLAGRAGPEGRAGIPSFFLPRVRAFSERRREDYERTAFFLPPQEWLSWRLGASPVTVIPHGGYEPYYWDKEQCAALGLDRGKFPPLVKMGAVTGRTSGTGPLGGGVPIAAAGPDFIMALIGTAVLEPGMCCDRTGSSEGINLCAAERPQEQFPSLRILPHAAEGLWNVGALIPRSGRRFDEFLAGNPYPLLSTGEILERLILGPPCPGKAVLEEMAGELNAALETLERAGFPAEELVISGGQAKNPLWNQYKADMTGRIFLEPEIIDAELAGNAVLGALILKGGSLRERASGMIRIRRRYTPGGGLQRSMPQRSTRPLA